MTQLTETQQNEIIKTANAIFLANYNHGKNEKNLSELVAEATALAFEITRIGQSEYIVDGFKTTSDADGNVTCDCGCENTISINTNSHFHAPKHQDVCKHTLAHILINKSDVFVPITMTTEQEFEAVVMETLPNLTIGGHTNRTIEISEGTITFYPTIQSSLYSRRERASDRMVNYDVILRTQDSKNLNRKTQCFDNLIIENAQGTELVINERVMQSALGSLKW